MPRRQCYFSGQVQGVGFRYTVQSLARRYNVTGFVRNLSDGRVELVMEGPDEDQCQLLQDIHERMDSYIRNADVTAAPETGEFDRFSIRH